MADQSNRPLFARLKGLLHGLWLLPFLPGCLTGPSGFLGAKWGDDADAAAKKLGVRCESWAPWEGDKAFEACFDYDTKVKVFERDALLRLFRQGHGLVGIAARFPECGGGREKLGETVRKELGLEEANPPGGDPYQIWLGGALVHMVSDKSESECTVTVAGPVFGKAFASYRMGEGLGSLSSGLGPR